MDIAPDIREFLASRRARITPEQAGLPAFGTMNRRVSGLRREEVAMLAGIGVEYYTRLERGTARGVSEDVLEGVARALQLDEAERRHLFDLARTANSRRPGPRRSKQDRIRPVVQRILDALTDVPAYVRNGRLDILAANHLGDALYSSVNASGGPRNIARFIFLDPSAPRFFSHWETIADDAVAILRGEAGRDPHDRRLTDLVGELSTQSEEFRVRWAAHNVKLHNTGVKAVHHPVVGDLALAYEALVFPADPDLMVLVYTAEPGSPSDDALKLLASWASAREGAQIDESRKSREDSEPRAATVESEERT